MAKYTIDSTIPQTYLDSKGHAIDGFIVYFQIASNDEMHHINVPTLDPKAIDTAINKLIANREALDKLGQ